MDFPELCIKLIDFNKAKVLKWLISLICYGSVAQPG